MRGKTPEELTGLATDRSTSRPRSSVSEVHPAPPSGGERAKDAGGAGCRREGARARRLAVGWAEGARAPHAVRGGAGDRRAGASRRRLRAGSLLDGDVRGSIDRAHVDGSWVLDPTVEARTWRLRVARRELPDAGTARVRPDRVRRRGCRSLRDVGASSRGDEAQESTGRAVVTWPGRDRMRERTLEGRKAAKRTCCGRRVRRAR